MERAANHGTDWHNTLVLVLTNDDKGDDDDDRHSMSDRLRLGSVRGG